MCWRKMLTPLNKKQPAPAKGNPQAKEKSKSVVAADYAEALMGFAILAKYVKTSGTFSTADILSFIQRVRTKSVKVEQRNGLGLIVLRIGKSGKQVAASLRLSMHFINALLRASPSQVWSQLVDVTKYLNNSTMENRLLAFSTKDVCIHADPSTKRSGDLLLKGDSIVFV
jgi:hypothetical protein